MKRRVLGAALLAATVGLGGMATTTRALPDDQVARGNETFAARCERCHGPAATEPDAPKLLERGWFNGFLNAATAQKYIKESMPNDEPGTLDEQQVWDVLAFLLKSNGVTADAPLGPETAAGIPLKGAP